MPHNPHSAWGKTLTGTVLATSLLATEAGSTTSRPAELGWGFSQVVSLARESARRPPATTQPALPAGLAEGGYDLYRGIRFRPAEAVWRAEDTLFHAQLFHLGPFYRHRVEINLVEDGHPRPLEFSPELFEYPSAIDPQSIPRDLGFAGVRLHYPLNRADYKDEVIAFLGASYFRAVGRGQVYGASVRGVAVNTAKPRPEEFPVFIRFWLVKPEKDATSAVIHALLESDSLTGAYRFIVRPGLDTSVDVEARLFTRRPIERLGVAPVTSMFLAGKTNLRGNDYRPEIHDSDVLLLSCNSGEWILRPLQNPQVVATSAFAMDNPRGFGLLQRERRFEQYQDLEAQHERRPSVWIEPLEPWGSGTLMLMEAPAAQEYDDNINAFWVPRRPIRSGEELAYRYRVRFTDSEPAGSTTARVLATRAVHKGTTARFFVDFGGGPLRGMTPEARLEPVVIAERGRISGVVLQHNPNNHTWRVFFDATADTPEAVEMRLFLRQGADAVTETWSYPWRPS